MKKTLFFVFVVPGIIALLVGFMISLREGGTVQAPSVVPTPIVTLKDGDVFDLENSYATKVVGGVPQTMMAYNRSIPGPVLRVKQGEKVTIRFKNNLDQETLLHSHGVRMENAYDGTHLVQSMMKTGDSFDYILTFPDPGVFIYHPHTVRDDLQQDLGLYGSIIVEPADPTYWPRVDREENIILDDLLVEDGIIAPHSPKYATHALMGRFGNTMFVNGEADLKLTAKQGEVVRYYLTNTANTRTFAFTMPGARMKLVGGDNGRYEKETFVDRVDVSPSERAIVDVYYELPKTVTMTHNPGPKEKTHLLATVDVKQSTSSSPFLGNFYALRSGDAYAASLDAYRSYLDKAPDKILDMTVDVDMNKIMQQMGGGMSGMSADGHDHGSMAMDHGSMAMGTGTGAMGGMMHQVLPVEWEDQMGAMNIFSTDKTTRWILRDTTDASSTTVPKDNLDVQWTFTEGDVVKVRLYNDPKSAHPMQHPFHVHGQRFLVLATNGVPNDNLVWKDTTQVKTGDTVDILIPMEHVGKWMAHCHILEHLASGMIILFDVLPKP
jgi:suppressor of ftsI